ncbi:MAG: hypothetical protein CM1200mP25_5190 [Acidobacteriota bacterium]|nr:MAG: hypothetical protein CM1200mP25_5190 [Acidobacteriota bacterium]
MKKTVSNLVAGQRHLVSSSDQLAVLRHVTLGQDFDAVLSEMGSYPLCRQLLTPCRLMSASCAIRRVSIVTLMQDQTAAS